jgi:predicted amidohydrolase YtcJ
LTRYVTELERLGFDMHIHAIGDRGVHEALNAIDAAGQANCSGAPAGATQCGNRRHRLTHIELVQPSDVPRFAAQGTIADLQMSSVYVEPQHRFDHVESLGANRIRERLWRLRDLWDAGATVVLSSDFDVGDLSPFKGMQRALTRGAQSLPNVDAAIRAYTINAAYLMRHEDRVGSIVVGKRADIIVLDQNLFNIAPRRIGATNVLRTFLDGREIWSRGGTSEPNGCSVAPGSGRFCTDCGPCAAGVGDCDRDNECATGLVCVDNIGATFGFAPGVDVCIAP